MNETKTPSTGADWTGLLTDPALSSHLEMLLQTYREAPAGQRDQLLLEAMRKIKGEAKVADSTAASKSPTPAEKSTIPAAPAAIAAESTPPFEPDIFTPAWGQDRRVYPRMKCFVAVELRVEGSTTPIWGNLANTSLGGCQVDTAAPIAAGVKLEIGLWVANGKIWVKGMIISGVVTGNTPTFGVRIKFDGLEPSERETLRHFLKFVQNTTKSYQNEHGYLAQMKR